MLNVFFCPFDQKSFQSRKELESHIESTHICFPEDYREDSEGEESYEENPAESLVGNSVSEDAALPTYQSDQALSTILGNIELPENPISDIGALSDRRILRIASAEHIAAVKKVKST